MQHATDIKEELSKRLSHQKELSDMTGQAFPENANAGSTKDAAIRLLRADEIECRVATVNAYGLRLLLYKDARVDQKMLDELFTPFGWKREHQEINGSLYCTVSVWDDSKRQWIGKQDVGTPSYSDKEKGQASDSFKRACFNWGIGRELYTAPDVWVPASRVHIKEKPEKKGHYYTTDRFFVQSISYNGRREISSLVIVDQNGREAFRTPQKSSEAQPEGAGASMAEPAKTRQSVEAQPDAPKARPENAGIQTGPLMRELERTGIPLETVLERYGIQDIRQMTAETLNKALNGLRKTKTKGAA